MNQVQQILASIMHDPAPGIGVWKHYNCPACIYRGQSRPDMKKRGNHMFTSDGAVAYNCYNCHLKSVWKPGRYMSRDMESLLSYFGASQKQLLQLRFIIKEMVESGDYELEDTSASKIYQKIIKRDLPPNTKYFLDWVNEPNVPDQFMKVAEAVNKRNPYLLDLPLMWSPDKNFRMYERFIIPYVMNGEIVGYTGRHIDLDAEKRYYNQVSTNIFYNFDLLNDDRLKTILVAEGPIDAGLMGGISANNYFLSNSQLETLVKAKERGKRIVIVPDRDANGLVAIDQAIKYGFSVALPDYGTVRDGDRIRRIKDFDEACAKFGRLFCLQMLHNSILDDQFDIRVYTDKWI